MRRLAALVAAGVTAALACAHPAPRRQAPAPPQAEERPRPPRPTDEPVPGPPRAEVGLASYYHGSLQGRHTASGTHYDGRAMTCAHRTLPFGTVLRVTEVESGRSVVVKVTDRGPFTKGRIVDLSMAAARALGIVDRGLVRVRLEAVGGRDDG